jgi:hypothetical protein
MFDHLRITVGTARDDDRLRVVEQPSESYEICNS